MTKKTALLIIDAQVNMFDGDLGLYKGIELIDTISALAAQARAQDVPIIYVRHNGGQGAPDQLGTPGWEIHPALKPQAGELIIDKRKPDSFANTDLAQELQSRGIERLILAGMQTEMCINATSRAAAALGYAVTIAADAHSTFDSDEMTARQIIAKHNADWAEIATVKNVAEIVLG